MAYLRVLATKSETWSMKRGEVDLDAAPQLGLSLDDGYQAMAANEVRDTEALAWCGALAGRPLYREAVQRLGLPRPSTDAGAKSSRRERRLR